MPSGDNDEDRPLKAPVEDSEQHWGQLAQQARTLAGGMSSVEGSRTMLEIASAYEKLAQNARRKSGKANGS